MILCGRGRLARAFLAGASGQSPATTQNHTNHPAHGSYCYRRTFPQRRQDQRGRGADFRFTRIPLDGVQNHAIRARHLSQWMENPATARLTITVGRSPKNWIAPENLTLRDSWLLGRPVPGGCGLSRDAWRKPCPRSVEAGGCSECDPRVEQHSQVSASRSYLTVLDPATADFKKSAQEFLDRADAVILHQSERTDAAWREISLKPVARTPPVSDFLHRPTSRPRSLNSSDTN